MRGQLERVVIFEVYGYRGSRWSNVRSKRPSDEKSKFELLIVAVVEWGL